MRALRLVWRWCWIVLPWVCGAAEIPEPVLPAGVGVNIHFVTGHEQDLDLIAAAGFKFVRMDFGWTGTETAKGQYTWREYDELLANLDRHGLRAIFIFDYSHPLYEETVTSPNPMTQVPYKNTASPRHPESIAAYARWAAAAATHYAGRHVVWEIWNEPNGQFWSPSPDAEQYTALALAACRAVREADPQANIVAPATSGFPWDYLETFLKSGVLEYLDAVSVHPYRDPRQPPETAAGDYQRLRALIDSHAPPAKRGQIPILSGEWGYSSFTRGVSLQNQAAFAARQQLANLYSGVPLSIWYDWKNDGTDANENEHNFGTVLPDLQPKPAYRAVQTLTRQLAGYRIVRRLSVPDDKDYVLVCGGPSGANKLAAWTLGEAHSIRLGLRAAPGKPLAAVSSEGASFSPKLDASELVLELSAAPQYVALADAEIAESAARK
ncbi:MAG: cellulase family glycosylhydrolase [Limisphaerales bacterium]